ncbi:hypothetical protein KSU18_23195, partial [Enterobacter quasiroggenkampii]|nr:hypothetical protein [Enterobacter quasiroggenkampii]
MSEEDISILADLKDKQTIVLLNKNDLKQEIEEEKILKYVENNSIIKISALQQEGIEELQDKIESMV